MGVVLVIVALVLVFTVWPMVLVMLGMPGM